MTEYTKKDVGKTVGKCLCGSKTRITKVTKKYVKKECVKCSMTHEDSKKVNGGIR